MAHQVKNYRPNRECVQIQYACRPHRGQIIGDLYLDGKFVRSAVVADVGKNGDAEGYCRRANEGVKE